MTYEEALEIINKNGLKKTYEDALEKELPVVISRDALVEEVGKRRDMTYSETFKFLMDNKDVEKEEVKNVLNNQVHEARREGKDVIIDMTNMSKKSRRSWVNEFSKYNKRVVLFVSGFNTLLDCNVKRGDETGKIIHKGTLKGMCGSFSLPLYGEGFSVVDIVWND